MKRGLRLVIVGMMGRLPYAGVTWQILHYLEGFRRLGHDVYYIEDTGAWPFDPDKDCITDDSTYAVNYISGMMNWCGLNDRWAYKATEQDGRIFGLSESHFTRVLREADVLINLSSCTTLNVQHMRIPIRVYLETDPVRPQIEIANGNAGTLSLLNAHTHHFSFGENLGAPDCDVPVRTFRYTHTRQPIILDWWQPSSDRQSIRFTDDRFTTISSWRQADRDIEWQGELYTWSKHHQFLRFLDLPSRTAQALELALAGDANAVQLLTGHGWRVLDACSLSKSIGSYHDYIVGSRGEFTVAKDQYARLRSGWFSDRSACYLAAGRPVVTQDTGFGNIFPIGEGLFAFSSMDEILAAFAAINSDYEKHQGAARAIAEEYFRAETVLGKLLGDLGVQ
jgi:hypothetical protein